MKSRLAVLATPVMCLASTRFAFAQGVGAAPDTEQQRRVLLLRVCELCERRFRTTSAVVRPDGTLQCFQPYGQEDLLVADLDLSTATGLFASRCRTPI